MSGCFWEMSDGRNGCNACTFIAVFFGFIYYQSSLSTPPVGQRLTRQWEAAVIEAIRTGNDIHDELFGGDAAGDHCHVCGILHEYDVFGANPLDQVCCSYRLDSSAETAMPLANG